MNLELRREARDRLQVNCGGRAIEGAFVSLFDFDREDAQDPTDAAGISLGSTVCRTLRVEKAGHRSLILSYVDFVRESRRDNPLARGVSFRRAS
jgi:hypothetical protein